VGVHYQLRGRRHLRLIRVNLNQQYRTASFGETKTEPNVNRQPDAGHGYAATSYPNFEKKVLS
jgi:hypothetical protein